MEKVSRVFLNERLQQVSKLLLALTLACGVRYNIVYSFDFVSVKYIRTIHFVLYGTSQTIDVLGMQNPR
jgi:hypothetical protein